MNVILKDGSLILAETVSLEPHIVITAVDEAAFIAEWNKFTPENLEVLEIYNGATRVAGFTDVKLSSAWAVYNTDGSITGHFYCEGSPAQNVDPDYKEAYEILTGELKA